VISSSAALPIYLFVRVPKGPSSYDLNEDQNYRTRCQIDGFKEASGGKERDMRANLRDSDGAHDVWSIVFNRRRGGLVHEVMMTVEIRLLLRYAS
jgi:hypothetical protein